MSTRLVGAAIAMVSALFFVLQLMKRYIGTRIVGIVITVASTLFFIWHLAKRGDQPHDFWAFIGGIAIIIGLWLALPGRGSKT